MKLKKSLIIILVVFFFQAKSQTLDDILSPKQMTITWLGVDFTHGKYIMAQKEKVQDYLPDYCVRINKTISEDHHRYFFPIAYKKDFVYNTKTIDSVNNQIEKSVLVTKKNELIELDSKKIQQIVPSYEFPNDLKGIGLVYIYESLAQVGNDKGTMWMAFINIETKEVLFIQNTTSGVEGRTLEESWAYPVLSMLRKSKSDINKWFENPASYNLLNK